MWGSVGCALMNIDPSQFMMVDMEYNSATWHRHPWKVCFVFVLMWKKS